MTAANLLVGPNAAYLLQDSAWYRYGDGVVTDVCSKIAKAAALRTAVGTAGCITLAGGRRICEWIESCVSQTELLDTAIDLADELARDIEETVSDEHPTDTILLIAMFRLEQMAPEGYLVSVARKPGAPTGKFARAFSIPLRCDFHIRPRVEFMPPPSQPLSKKDARRLIDAQRNFTDERGLTFVGGSAEFVTVDETGVHSTIVRRWPDKPGRASKPSQPWWKRVR